MNKNKENFGDHLLHDYSTRGWVALPFSDDLFSWVNGVKASVNQKLQLMCEEEKDVRCGGTWFPGVNFLDNDPHGNIDGSIFPSDLTDLKKKLEPAFSGFYDRAQISICYPGYPKKMDDETVSAFNYRKNRFAAHLDGLLPIGQHRRRFLMEHHAFIYGIPINLTGEGSSPCVVWEGSHKVVQNEFKSFLTFRKIHSLQDQDVTEFYSSIRKKIFASCRMKKIWLPVGQSYLIHRLTLHGILPWVRDAKNTNVNRTVAYFRPHLIGGHETWLD